MNGYAIYICGDEIGAPGGAGQVTKHELAVLQRMYGAENVVALQFKDGRPDTYDQLDIPFLSDYFVLAKVARLCGTQGPPRHVHIYSGCYTETVRYLKNLRNMAEQPEQMGWAFPPKVSVTCPAHDRALSMKERGPSFFLPHIDIDSLWQQHLHGLRLADLVIVPGGAPKRFLESEGVKPERLVVIPHGIERFPETVKPFPEVFRVGYLGATGPDKGIRYLLDAWGRLALPDAELWLAGAGTENLEKLVRQYVPSGKVRLLGWVESPYAFYQELSVYCQPSVCEGFGIEVAEALACGRPCIVSTGAGAADLVIPQGEKATFLLSTMPGLTVQPADVTGENGLVAALRILHAHRQDLPAMGAVAREVAKHLTWENVEAQYEAIFYSRLGV